MSDTLGEDQIVRFVVTALRYPDRNFIRFAVKVVLLSGRPLLVLLEKAETKRLSNPWIIGYFVEEVHRLGRTDLLRDLLNFADGRFGRAAAILLSEGTASRQDAVGQPKSSPAPNDPENATPAQLEPLDVSEQFMAHLVSGKPILVTDLDRAFPLLQSSMVAVQGATWHAILDVARESPAEFFDALEAANVPTDTNLFTLLGFTRDPRAVRVIEARYASDGSHADRAAIEALAKIADVRAAELLIRIMRPEDDDHCRYVVRALEQIGPAAIEPLLQSYAKDVEIRRVGGDLLGRLAGTSAIEVLVNAMRFDRYLAVKEEAANGLTAVGSPAVDSLADLLEVGDSELQSRVATILGDIGDRRALGPLMRLACGQDPQGRRAAVEALGKIADEAAFAPIAEAIHARDRRLRELAARALGQIGSTRAVPLLLVALQDRDDRVRTAAIRSLVHLPVDQAERGHVSLALIGLLSDSVQSVARAASMALTEIGKDALPSLEESLKCDYPENIIKNINNTIHNISINCSDFDLDDSIIDYSLESRRHMSHARSSSAMKSEPAEGLDDHRVDHVFYSIVAPRVVVPGTLALLDVWVHLEVQREEVRRRARKDRPARSTRFRSGGPIGVLHGSSVGMRLEIPDFGITGLEDEVLWDGSVGMLSFGMEVPRNAAIGPHAGVVRVLVNGLQAGRLYFEVEVGEREKKAGDLMTRAELIRLAFASYAAEDFDEVLGRVQGMLKILPDLDVFLDVLKLRSGEDWERRIEDEIASRDAFFLFWSLAASRSNWVEKEWRMALERKGVGFIDPVPLVPASVAPPPIELSRLHFNDWTLAMQKKSVVADTRTE